MIGKLGENIYELAPFEPTAKELGAASFGGTAFGGTEIKERFFHALKPFAVAFEIERWGMGEFRPSTYAPGFDIQMWHQDCSGLSDFWLFVWCDKWPTQVRSVALPQYEVPLRRNFINLFHNLSFEHRTPPEAFNGGRYFIRARLDSSHINTQELDRLCGVVVEEEV